MRDIPVVMVVMDARHVDPHAWVVLDSVAVLALDHVCVLHIQ